MIYVEDYFKDGIYYNIIVGTMTFEEALPQFKRMRPSKLIVYDDINDTLMEVQMVDDKLIIHYLFDLFDLKCRAKKHIANYDINNWYFKQ